MGFFKHIKHIHFGHTSIVKAIKKSVKKTEKAIKKSAKKTGKAIKKTGKAIKKTAKKTGKAIEKSAKKTGNVIKKISVKTGDAYVKIGKTIEKNLKKGAKVAIKEEAHNPILKESSKIFQKAVKVEKDLDKKSGGALTAATIIMNPEARAGMALADVASKAISKGEFNPKDLQEVSDSLMAPAVELTALADKAAEKAGVPESIRETTTELLHDETAGLIAPMMTPNVGHMIDTTKEGRLDKTIMEAGKPLNKIIAIPLAIYDSASEKGTKRIRKRKRLIKEYNQKKEEALTNIKDYMIKLDNYNKAKKARKDKIRKLMKKYKQWLENKKKMKEKRDKIAKISKKNIEDFEQQCPANPFLAS